MSKSGRKTILIIEDDPAVLLAYGRLLERLDHRIFLRPDCDAARRDPGPLQESDLLILDQQMPGGCGLEFLAELRGEFRWRDGATGPAVLLITAAADEEMRGRARRLGVTEVIEKPVDPARLLESVRAILDSGHRAPSVDRAAGDWP